MCLPCLSVTMNTTLTSLENARSVVTGSTASSAGFVAWSGGVAEAGPGVVEGCDCCCDAGEATGRLGAAGGDDWAAASGATSGNRTDLAPLEKNCYAQAPIL